MTSIWVCLAGCPWGLRWYISIIQGVAYNVFILKIHGHPTRSNYKNLKKEAFDLASKLDDITYNWSQSPTGKDYGLLAKNHRRGLVLASHRSNMGPRNQTSHLWSQHKWHHSNSYQETNGTGVGQDAWNIVPPATNVPSPIKQYANWGTCFLCGFDIKDAHRLGPFVWCKPRTT